jgi:hypothetical protein
VIAGGRMFEDMFPFISPDDDMFHSTVQIVALYFDLMEKEGMDKAVPGIPVKTDIPLDIALSLLKPDELQKLRNYVAAYLAKHPG